MTTDPAAAAREKLASIIMNAERDRCARLGWAWPDGMEASDFHLHADRILAAGFRLPEAPPSGNEAVDAARAVVAARATCESCDEMMPGNRAWHHETYREAVHNLALPMARYILSIAAPVQDAVAEARDIACISLAGIGTTHPVTMPALQFLRDRLADNIAAALTAREAKTEARVREECCRAAATATLPEGYQWGHDALEQFEFGKARAVAAIRAGGKA